MLLGHFGAFDIYIFGHRCPSSCAGQTMFNALFFLLGDEFLERMSQFKLVRYLYYGCILKKRKKSETEVNVSEDPHWGLLNLHSAVDAARDASHRMFAKHDPAPISLCKYDKNKQANITWQHYISHQYLWGSVIWDSSLFFFSFLKFFCHVRWGHRARLWCLNISEGSFLHTSAGCTKMTPSINSHLRFDLRTRQLGGH